MSRPIPLAVKVFNIVICDTGPPLDKSNVSDPAPLVPFFVGEDAGKLVGNCSQVIARGPDPESSPLWQHQLDGRSGNGVVKVFSIQLTQYLHALHINQVPIMHCICTF